MTNAITAAAFHDLRSEIAAETDSRIYESYSGRGMYGARCYGISCSRYAMAKVECQAIKLGLGEKIMENQPQLFFIPLLMK